MNTFHVLGGGFLIVVLGCATKSDVAEIDEKVNMMSGSLAEVAEATKLTNDKVEVVSAGVRDVAEANANFHHRAAEKIDGLERKVDHHEDVLTLTGLHDAREAYIQGKNTHVYTKAELDDLLDNYATQGELDKVVKKGELEVLKEDVTSINKDISLLKTRMDNFEGTLKSVERQLEQVATLDELKSAIESSLLAFGTRFPEGLTNGEFAKMMKLLKEQVAAMNRKLGATQVKIVEAPPPGTSLSTGPSRTCSPFLYRMGSEIRHGRRCDRYNVWQP